MPGMSPRIKAKKGRFGSGGLSPVVSILSPADGFSVSAAGDGSPLLTGLVTFVGEAHDDLGAVDSSNITWASDIDGGMGTGASVAFELSIATHVITALIDDGFNVTGDTITVTVTA